MKRFRVSFRRLLASLTALSASTAQLLAVAQESQQEPQQESQQANNQVIEEVFAVGRFVSASQQLVNERLDDANVSDVLGADSISRLGDSTVAAALRRVPGLTLVADRFVYVRGLGERYSTATLNGAQIPSPDLTRNVIPLDVFPTAVVQSLRVQKSWSPNLTANFGGGLMDIRTKGIPDGLDFSFELGSGFNSENPSTGLTYPGGGDDELGADDGTRALSPEIRSGIAAFQGNVDTATILQFLRRQDQFATRADAQQINTDFALQLNRNAVVEKKDIPADVEFRASAGNTFHFNDNWSFGILGGASYQTDWRRRTTLVRDVGAPDEQYSSEDETTQNVNISGSLNLGLNFTEDHQIATTSLWLRDTDDETAVRDYFDANRQKSSGTGFRDYRFDFEERELRTNQIRGTHYLGEATRDALPGIFSVLNWIPVDTRIDWFYSDSDAMTSIPNRAVIRSGTVTDGQTGQVLSAAVRPSATAGDYRFTDLLDQVRNSGTSLSVPIETDRSKLEISGGFEWAQKARTYEQLEFTLGPLSIQDTSILAGPLNEVFSDANVLDQANDFVFSRVSSNTESYLAATATDGAFANADWTFNDRYRFGLGARWEDYRQDAVNWNSVGFTQSSPQVTTNVVPSQGEALQDGAFHSDDVYPAGSFTYMGHFWADTFQLRLGASQTAVRPDLREITDASYVDPITGIITRGSSGVVPSDVSNLDIRGEWFFDSGDNFTVTLYNKDIDNPIEFFEFAAGSTDSTLAREIINADSATVKGIEFEGLKKLGFLGGIWDTLFIQGNLTLQDSELVAGAQANSPTNPTRSLSGASDYVVNFMIGYDSRNAQHTASLAFNTFGERLFAAGRLGVPDSFEQPFNSLDVTYSWYPTDKLALKVKLQNLLGETTKIDQGGVRVYEEDPGSTYKLSLQWTL